MTDRAVRYHDKAVQENWHAAESLMLMGQDKNNWAEAYSIQEKKVLRKRIVGMILATDMADHMSHLQVMKYNIENRVISKEANNSHLLVDH